MARAAPKTRKTRAETRSNKKTRKVGTGSLAGAHGCHSARQGADHGAQISRLNRVIGQLRGIGRMIEAKRYCPDILVQTRAAVSAIGSLESAILEDHLRHCVKQAFAAKTGREAETMIKELTDLFASRD